MRRRRRPARGRRARAHRRTPDRQWTPVITARSPSCSSLRGRRAPGCGTSWATTGAGSTSRMSATMSANDLGARRDPRDRLDPALSGPARTLLDALVPSLRVDVSLRTAAYTILGLARLDPDRLDHDARLLLERLVEQLASAYHGSAAGSWLWFEDRLAYDNARLSQALIVGGSALRRPDDGRHRARVARMAGRRMRPRRRHAAPAGASWTRPRRARPWAGTSSLSTRPRSSRPSSPRLSRRGTASTERVSAQRVRLVPGPKSARPPALRLRDRRLQRRSGETDLNANQGAESARLPSCPAAARRCRPPPTDPRSGPRRRDVEHEVFRRHAGNPIDCADWSQPVNAVFNPAAALVDGETVVLARVEDRRGISHLGVARSADGLVDGRSLRSRCSRRPTGSKANSGASKTHVQSGWRARALADHVHGVRPERPGRLSRVDDGFSDGRAGIICQPEDKNAALLSERVDGQWVLFHRPMTSYGGSRGEVVSLPVGRPDELGPASRSCSRGTAPGGTRFGSASARHHFARTTAGW